MTVMRDWPLVNPTRRRITCVSYFDQWKQQNETEPFLLLLSLFWVWYQMNIIFPSFSDEVVSSLVSERACFIYIQFYQWFYLHFGGEKCLLLLTDRNHFCHKCHFFCFPFLLAVAGGPVFFFLNWSCVPQTLQINFTWLGFVSKTPSREHVCSFAFSKLHSTARHSTHCKTQGSLTCKWNKFKVFIVLISSLRRREWEIEIGNRLDIYVDSCACLLKVHKHEKQNWLITN